MEPRRMLALDGGGVRGLTILLILQSMMERINPQNPPKPCEVFDLIGGTSTGGLIAVMLGRLEMDVESAIDAYLDFSASIFKPKRKKLALFTRVADALKTSGRFDTDNFEKCIKNIIQGSLGDENALLLQEGNSKCKVFVCAIRRENAQPVFLRSYHSTQGHEVSCTIWEACRATAAATSIFEPVKIGPFNEEFVDGATGFNNPVNEVLMEARDLWPDTIILRNIGCLVSVGTGLRPNSSFGPSVMQVGRALLRIASETEKTAERFHRAYPTLVSENKYFRFNVQKGLEDVGLSEHDKTNVLAAATRSYLMLEMIRIQLRYVVEAIDFHPSDSASKVRAAFTILPPSGNSARNPAGTSTTSATSTPETSQNRGNFPSSLPLRPLSKEPTMGKNSNSTMSPGLSLGSVARNRKLGDSSPSSISKLGKPATEGEMTQKQPTATQSSTAVIAIPSDDPPADEEDSSDDMGGANTHEVKTFGSVQSWVRSFQPDKSSPLGAVSDEDFATRFAKVKQLVLDKGPAGAPSDSMGTSSSTIFDRFPKGQFARRQPVPTGLRQLVKRAIDDEQVHIIVQGLGPLGVEKRAKMFPSNATINTIHEYLDKEGFGPLCAFKVHTDQGSYDVERVVQKTTMNPVTVTDGPSCYKIQDGYSINQDERLISFYNSRFAGKSQIQVSLRPDCIEVKDDHNTKNGIFVDFKRTVRVPDDDRTYNLPPPLASFPLLPTWRFSSTLPDSFREKGGIFFPMLQREAFMLAYSSSSAAESQFAMRVFTGAVNALTGRSALQATSRSSNRDQDYVLAPQQGLLSGYRAAHDTVKQFVAMPMGDEYTVESQITGEEFIGGIQLEIIPRLRETATFTRLPPESDTRNIDNPQKFELFATPRKLGLNPGQRVFMQDHQPRRLYSYPDERYQPSKDLIEPAAYSDLSKSRPAFIRELYDGPLCMDFDLSSSLVISAIQPIAMTMGPFKGHPEKISFGCSPFARMTDMRRFIRERISFVKIGRLDEMTLTIGERSFGKDDDTVIGELNLEGTQKIGIQLIPYNMWNARLGAGGGRSQQVARIVPGWDMGVAMGGRIKQAVIKDERSDIWNWAAARTVNIQIINAVAFRAVTGLCPPISPFSSIRYGVEYVPGIPEPASVKRLVKSTDPLRSAKSMNELDWERGAALGVTLDGNSVVLCVCCEANICDSMMDKCGHLFCGRCITYYLTENTVIKCAFCSAVTTRVIQIGAPSEAPHKPRKYSILGPEAKDDGDRNSKADLIETHTTLEQALQTFNAVLDGNLTATQLKYSIGRPLGGKLPGKSATLQILLAQAMRDPAFMATLNIGRLIREALNEQNRAAWLMLVPLYGLTDHEGLQFAEQTGLDVLATVEELGVSGDGSDNLNSAVLTLGIQKATLLVKLAIFDADVSAANVRHTARNSQAAELRLLLSMGADPTAVDKDGETALHLTSNGEIARMLCEAGAPIAALDGDRNTVISKAAAYARKDALEVLLEQDGAREILNDRNKYGKAAIHYAKSKPEIVTMLVEAGADPDLKIEPRKTT